MALGNRPSLQILFLEDQETARREGKTDLEARLAEGGIVASVAAVGTLDAALNQLKGTQFHVAVIDLRLEGSQADGNEVIRSITGSQVLPIIVYTGFAEELAPEFQDSELIYVESSKKMRAVADKILEWQSQRVLEFFSAKGFITSWFHGALLKAMWQQLPAYWRHLPLEDADRLNQIVARIALSLFQETLASSPELAGSGHEVSIHPAEIYILHTPRLHLALGDLIELDDSPCVVLTPACDLIPRPDAKAPVVLLAKGVQLKDFATTNQQITQDMEKALRALNAAPPQDKYIKTIMQQSARFNEAGQYFVLPPLALSRARSWTSSSS